MFVCCLFGFLLVRKKFTSVHFTAYTNSIKYWRSPATMVRRSLAACWIKSPLDNDTYLKPLTHFKASLYSLDLQALIPITLFWFLTLVFEQEGQGRVDRRHAQRVPPTLGISLARDATTLAALPGVRASVSNALTFAPRSVGLTSEKIYSNMWKIAFPSSGLIRMSFG